MRPRGALRRRRTVAYTHASKRDDRLKGIHTMHRLPALRVRFAELAMMRREHQALGKAHFVGYIDQLLADVEREIADIERTARPKAE